MDKDDKNVVFGLLALPTILAMFLIAMIPVGLFNAWATQKLYDWFVIPLGAPHINLWEVWGLSILIAHFTASSSNDDSFRKTMTKLVARMVATLIAVGVGFILKQHIGVYK